MRWHLDELAQPPIRTLNCRGKLLFLERPVVMGILNLTPDSFSDGGLYLTPDAALAQTERMLSEGASIVDVGAASSRPGAEEVPEAEELRRLESIAPRLLEAFPEAIFSIDSTRTSVAREMLSLGMHIINDISGGRFDKDLFALAAEAGAPVVLMHMRGTPATMQDKPHYEDVVEESCQFLIERVRAARQAGIHDLILDPGFGFGKLQEHNLRILACLDRLTNLRLPVLVGLSRKRMVQRVAQTDEAQTLAAVQGAMHLQALMSGARLLRVHDVGPAVRVIELFEHLTHGTVFNRLP